MRTAAVLAFFVLPVAAVAAAADGQWIWCDSPAPMIHFEKSLELPGVPATARLQAAGDFAALRILVNERVVAEVAPYGPIIDLEIGSFLKTGKNSIGIEAWAVPGPSAVALAIIGARGELLVTDDTWSAKDGTGNTQEKTLTTVARGALKNEAWWALPPVRVTTLDDYEQWQRAKGVGEGADTATFFTLPNFEVERLHSAQPNEGSWVSLAFDPKGRLTIGREDTGLLRFSFAGERGAVVKREQVDVPLALRECRGLVYHRGYLFAHANVNRGLFRLRDSNGDGTFDKIKRLHESAGGGGHGRNALAVGPDGMIYGIHGDAVHLPDDAADRTSPLRRGRQPFRKNEGHVVRVDVDGGHREIVTAGLRNPYGIAFNADGEAFTYDADAEHDMGSPWYRPTQVKQLVSGGDFGWRAVTRSWPAYFPDHPDNAQPTLTIGKGSPTGVEFGTKSRFPRRYQRALFILDWTYGRILAVHLDPRGAGYRARPEVFLQGRPLNVTDLTFGPDGHLYFVTGGRKTQSALYRVRYTEPQGRAAAPTAQQRARRIVGDEFRGLRRYLETFHRAGSPDDIPKFWSHLRADDPAVRYAARIALEHVPVDAWREKALVEENPALALTALTALAAADISAADAIVKKLLARPLAKDSVYNQERVLYLIQICYEQAAANTRSQLPAFLNAAFPSGSTAVNRRAADLLLRLPHAGTTAVCMRLLQSARNQYERFYYLYALRHTKIGWTRALRETYFRQLNAGKRFLGGRGLPQFLKQIRRDAVRSLTEAEKTTLGDLVKPTGGDDLPAIAARPFVKLWTMADLAPKLGDAGERDPQRDLENGRRLFDQALCSRCHRVRGHGRAVGPDLTGVSRRFNRRDLLEAILEPSKAVGENYRTDELTLTDGRVLSGLVIPQLDYRSKSLLLATNPLEPEKTVVIPKAEIKRHRKSPHSIMPPALLSTLSETEILDLLHWLGK